MTTAIRPRPATAKTEPPHHNNLTCYKQYRCRLPACVERNNAYARNMRRRQAEGTWQPLTDATPAREHIRTLMASGVGYRQIARIVGTNPADLSQILYQNKRNSPRNRIRPALAQRILNVPLDTTPDTNLVDALGTRRRIQALAAMGWPQRHVARYGGWAEQSHWIMRADKISAETATRVTAAYDRLRVMAPEHHGITPRIAGYIRVHARRNGWASPIAWDDIDDPQAAPDLDGTATQAPAARKRDKLRNEEIEHLAGFGIDAAEIGRRLGLNEQDVADRIKKSRREARTEKQAVTP